MKGSVTEDAQKTGVSESNEAVSEGFGGHFLRLPCFQTQYSHALEIPGQTNQRPLTRDLAQPPQRELAKPHHRLDDAKHRLHRLFAQRIDRPATLRFESMRHGLHRSGLRWQSPGSLNRSCQCG